MILKRRLAFLLHNIIFGLHLHFFGKLFHQCGICSWIKHFCHCIFFSWFSHIKVLINTYTLTFCLTHWTHGPAVVSLSLIMYRGAIHVSVCSITEMEGLWVIMTVSMAGFLRCVNCKSLSLCAWSGCVSVLNHRASFVTSLQLSLIVYFYGNHSRSTSSS